MNDKAHVAFVNSHAKSYRGDNYVDLVSHPLGLNIFSCRVTHPCMVKITTNLVLRELRAKYLTLLPRKTINDARHVQELLFDNDDDIFGQFLFLYSTFVSNFVS